VSELVSGLQTGRSYGAEGWIRNFKVYLGIKIRMMALWEPTVCRVLDGSWV